MFYESKIKYPQRSEELSIQPLYGGGDFISGLNIILQKHHDAFWLFPHVYSCTA
jgi:hypothetical protein